MHLPRFPLAAALVLLAVACTSSATPGTGSPSAVAPSGSGSPAIFPVVISQELVVGRNRVLFSFLDASGTKPIAAPDRTVKVAFTGPNGETVAAPDGEFIWAIEDVSGVYVTTAEFPSAGAWTAQFTTAAPGSQEETIPFGFDVKEDANVVLPGEAAPAVDTPTLEDVGGDVRMISSDDEPVEAFYETSVADALAAGEPFVLVFATPAFCQTQTCGPTLEKVKDAAEAHSDVTFINVEPYQTEFVEGRLEPVLSESNLLQTVPAADAYGLVTEPYIFVVDGDGIVSASFELLFTPEEMDAALDAVS
ncbi:MAG TPA: hypothetical protein VFO78_06290 [Candidatus Limnocylindrales bacterium]|nr:hypothetical protein [Candidatus Limnocylindrales bacterium]